MVRITLTLPMETVRLLREKAAQRNCSLSQVMRDLISKGLAESEHRALFSESQV